MSSESFQVSLPNHGVELSFARLSGVLRHTGQNTVTVELPYTDVVKRAAQSFADLEVRYDDELLFRGIVADMDRSKSHGEASASLQAVGRTWFLERSGPDTPFEIDSNRVDSVIEEYAATELDGWDVTVEPNPGSPVVTDELAFEADDGASWGDVLEAIPSDVPVRVQNDRPELVQAHFPRDGLDRDSPSSVPTFRSDDEYNRGEAIGIVSSTDTITWEITVNHDIPEEHVGVKVRDDADDYIGFRWSLDGDTMSGTDGGGNLTLGWSGIDDQDIYTSYGDGYSGGDLEAGETYTLAVEGIDDDGDAYYVDAIAVYDKRYLDESKFSGEWDSVHEPSGYLDGPPEHPDTVTLETVIEERQSNVESATLTTSWRNDDVSGTQSLGLSNGGGTEYVRESNTDTLSVDFAANDQFGEQLRGELALSNTDDGPQSSLPRFGYDFQAIDELNLIYSQSSVPIIADTSLDEDHWSNITRLCDRGRMRSWADPSSEERRLHIFPIGHGGPEVKWQSTEQTESLAGVDYANIVTVRGARQDDGTRLEATVPEDPDTDDEIQELQAELEELGVPEDVAAEKARQRRTILDVELTTQQEVNNAAFGFREEFLRERDLKGELEIAPALIPMGYRYPAPEFDGEELDSERLTFSFSHGDASSTLEFKEEESLVPALTRTRGEVSGIKTRL